MENERKWKRELSIMREKIGEINRSINGEKMNKESGRIRKNNKIIFKKRIRE